MRYKGAPPRRGGCTIKKQMLVPKKHLKLTLMRNNRGRLFLSTSSVRRGVHLHLKEKDSGFMFNGEGG